MQRYTTNRFIMNYLTRLENGKYNMDTDLLLDLSSRTALSPIGDNTID
jgi:hypothetical protein